MSDAQGAKAISLVQSGGIVEVPGTRTFEVPSRGYTVTLHAAVGSRMDRCDCDAGLRRRRCYHVRAARLLVEQAREADAADMQREAAEREAERLRRGAEFRRRRGGVQQINEGAS